ncbi:MAG: FHA domain-containing protein [Bellilinea sp.]
MIKCPNCQHQELPGALFCSECGARLVAADTLTSPLEKESTPYIDSGELVNGEPFLSPAGTPVKIRETIITLKLMDANRVIHLSGRSEYSLGRVAKGQPILPDFDLTEFDAYQKGVSRLHAAIKVGAQRIVIMDLRSANGTRVNGQKILPNVDYPLKHGDIIALGKLKFQFLLNLD